MPGSFPANNNFKAGPNKKAPLQGAGMKTF
jgi:hypothetical protein